MPELPGERMIECLCKDWYHIDTCVGGALIPSHLDSSLSWFCKSVCKLPTCCLLRTSDSMRGSIFSKEKVLGGSVYFKKLVRAHDFGGVQILQ